MHYSVVLSKAFRRLALWARTCLAQRVTEGCLSGVSANVVDAHLAVFLPLLQPTFSDTLTPLPLLIIEGSTTYPQVIGMSIAFVS